MTDLFSWEPPPQIAFDGATYSAEDDHMRLRGQLQRVHTLMSDGRWRTLEDIRFIVGGSESSISARLRDLRKAQYGSREIQRERVSGGLYRYRLVVTCPA